MRKLLTILALGCSLCMVACSSGGKSVTRIDEKSTTDLSGKWNDTDSRLVADEMITSCLSSARIEKMIGEMGKTPTVVIGKVRNKSHEHISVETFVKDMERALLNSGAVDFVANSSERAELREEVMDQRGNATEETAKALGMESGADWMLTGTINTIVDQEGGQSVIFYQVDLELTDLQSHKKLWMGDKKIKKFISKDSVKL
ncbi:penicillin-binding protein activator LpoB [uncultured Fibrobacter sp.]|uniref:penicillin-binding protein activator LpoB n=1 Tax=uncultured Fibrobacter sp. TaxID=261512 RepID=UPI00260E94D5|nr:penicillin-binding protein activator LpoB [uncultured Fibrobacter sp.]